MSLLPAQCLQAAELALKLGRPQDAAALCRHVLATHRWHLRAHLLLGQAYLEQEEWSEAGGRLRMVLAVDPECAEAGGGLAVVARARGDGAEAVRLLARAFENAPESDELRDALRQALSQQAGRPVPPPAFTPACVGRFYLRRGLPGPAAEAYAAAYRTAAERDDVRLAYAVALWQSGVHEQAANLVRPLLEKTPRPLVALLLSAAAQLLADQPTEGRRLWLEARAWDPEESRAAALFGAAPGLPLPTAPTPLPPLEAEELQELLAMAAAPPEAGPLSPGAAALELAAYARHRSGIEQTAKAPQPTDPDLRRFQATVQEIAHRLFAEGEAVLPPPPPAPHAGRRTAEVILAWEEGLRRRMGAAAWPDISRALQELAAAAEKGGLASRVVYLDRPPYPEIPVPDPADAQQIKAFLDSLDRRLGEEGLDLHYLTLVGGDSLLPLAPLPNPSEDTDELVPSDNLYASRDPTYLIPERAVGRLVTDGLEHAAPFLEMLERCAAQRRGEGPAARPAGCLGYLAPWLDLLSANRGRKAWPQRRFGLSAQVWAPASQEVFRTLPGTEPLHLCPPACRDGVSSEWLADVPLAYFNLHGALDSAHWYGQRDLASAGSGPLMPVAFAPDKVPAGRAAGLVVFSEACYGAHTGGKDRSSSIALRFLAEGALAVVGSTVISYGVSAPPLTDADLLGLYFWRGLLRGLRLGDALLQAKIEFTREIYRRQGYLDGDDMKTLLEFVLYGDPLAALVALPSSEAQRLEQEKELPTPPVLCGRHAKTIAMHQLSGDLVARVRRSLCWLQQGQEVGAVEVSLRSGCAGGGCRGQCHDRGDGGKAAAGPEALVFSTHRQVQTEDGTAIPQWARVVVDPRGRIVKMAVTK